MASSTRPSRVLSTASELNVLTPCSSPASLSSASRLPSVAAATEPSDDRVPSIWDMTEVMLTAASLAWS